MRTRQSSTLLVIALSTALVPALGRPPILAAPAAPPTDAALCAVLPRPTLRIRLVIESDVPQDLRTLVESTVATVWRGEGLTIEWQPAPPADSPEPSTHFWLRLTGSTLGRTRAEAERTFGAVRIFDGLPHRDVRVSWTAIREWARMEHERRVGSLSLSGSFNAHLRIGDYEALARVTAARVAAHEVGHYLLASTAHERSGLMRADLARQTLASASPVLILSPSSRRRLQERLRQGAACARAAGGSP